MVVGFTNQLPATFREGCQGQATHPKETVLALCASCENRTLLKNYFPIYLYLWIPIVGKLGQRMISTTWAAPNFVSFPKSFFFGLIVADRSYNQECKLLNIT